MLKTTRTWQDTRTSPTCGIPFLTSTKQHTNLLLCHQHGHPGSKAHESLLSTMQCPVATAVQKRRWITQVAAGLSANAPPPPTETGDTNYMGETLIAAQALNSGGRSCLLQEMTAAIRTTACVEHVDITSTIPSTRATTTAATTTVTPPMRLINGSLPTMCLLRSIRRQLTALTAHRQLLGTVPP